MSNINGGQVLYYLNQIIKSVCSSFTAKVCNLYPVSKLLRSIYSCYISVYSRINLIPFKRNTFTNFQSSSIHIFTASMINTQYTLVALYFM